MSDSPSSSSENNPSPPSAENSQLTERSKAERIGIAKAGGMAVLRGARVVLGGFFGFLMWLSSAGLFAAVVGTIVGLFSVAYFSRDLPSVAALQDYEPPVTTRLYASDGHLLAEYAIENRVFVPIDAMPPQLLQAFISAEDQNFYRHPGIDMQGIIRAMVTNVQNMGSGQRPEGASTITQQVAKNFLLTNEVSLARKVREALLAFRIESTYEKDRILELYVNQIYLGRGAYGVATAALNYFNKALSELTLAESAYLAALPKAPNNYHPTLRREAAIARRNYVIDRMLEDGHITATQAQEAKAEELIVVNRQETAILDHDYFAEEVRRLIQQNYGDDMLYEGGLTVRTTMVPELQELAERVLRNGLIDYDRRHGWRGPLGVLASFDNWAQQLAQFELPPDIDPWQAATVLELQEDRALIGFADGSWGQIPMDELRWAREWQPEQRVGPEPRSPEDVLALGDIILVEYLAEGEEEQRNEQSIRLPLFALRQIPDVSGGLVALDPHTGRVLAVAGGFSFEMSEFNRATQAWRQPGSAFKPFVYLTALDHGYTPSTIVQDLPLEVDQGPGLGIWRPANYAHDFLGPVPLRKGIERSRNLMTVRLLIEIGLEPVRDTARAFGVIDDMELLYSMALGAGETTLLRMTAGYGVFAAGGRAVTPTFIDRIQDRHGNTLYRFDDRQCLPCQSPQPQENAPLLPDTRPQIADPISSYQILSMLQGVVQRGTATRLTNLGIPSLAGKTGTTNDSFDAWFVGFSPDLAVGVYVGFDNPRTLGPRETGSSVAVPIFGAFMGEALEGQEIPAFRPPPGISFMAVNANTGLPARGGDSRVVIEAFRPGTEPSANVLNIPTSSNPEQEINNGGTGTGGIY